jgi:putative redox protein
VVTIGSPATASHVTHLFAGARDTLAEEGETQVQIGGRAFCIRQQFLDDLDQYADADHLRDLKRPLLVFHSPLDEIVSINEAAKIYQSALHPKSFISLDKADHLLTRREDAEYVAETLVAWASRYLALTDQPFERSGGTAPDVAPGEVLVTERDKTFLRGLYSANHQLNADEPMSAGGSDMGPSPYELLLMSLGACTSMTLRLYANHKRWPLDDVSITLSHNRVHADDCADCADAPRQIERIRRVVTLQGDLTTEQRRRLLEIADRCPVHQTLEIDLQIDTVLAPVGDKKTGH